MTGVRMRLWGKGGEETWGVKGLIRVKGDKERKNKGRDGQRKEVGWENELREGDM